MSLLLLLVDMVLLVGNVNEDVPITITIAGYDPVAIAVRVGKNIGQQYCWCSFRI